MAMVPEHDPMCGQHGKTFVSVTFDGTPFPCDCDLIARVRAQAPRVEITAVVGKPTTCRVWVGGQLVFDGVDRVTALLDGGES